MVKELIQARRPHPCSHCSFCRMSNAVSVLDLCFGLNATLLDTGSWLCFDERVSSSVDVRYWRTVGRSGCNYMYITKYLDLLPSEASQVGIFVEPVGHLSNINMTFLTMNDFRFFGLGS